MQKADKAAERIAELYNKALGDINRDKNKILRELERLAANRGLTEEEYLRQYINVDKTSYPDLVKLLNETDDTRMRAEILTRMDSMAYGARISRLEEVQMRIYLRIAEAAKAEQSIQKKLYKDILQGAYYENINTLAKGYNVGIDFSLLPSRAIDAALKEPWRGGNYSSRIWSKSAAFEKKVEEIVVNGLLTGKSHYISAKSLNEYTDFGDYATRRLVRTETAHFMGIGQLEAYDVAGIDKYRFIAALSERTCGSCADLDGQVFERSQAREGENYPPIHPNCRCITVTADADLKTRKARDLFTGENYSVRGDMTYNEWVSSLTEEQKAAFNTHVRQYRNMSGDKKQYQKYKVIYKDEFPKTFDKFQEMKYTKISEWEAFKSNKQEHLNKMDFKEMGELFGKLSNKEIREWYKYHDENIINLLDTSKTLEEQARQACELRNQYKFEARELMRDQEARKGLDKNQPHKSFEDLVRHKKEKYGLSGDDLYEDIIRSSGTTNPKYDKKAGLE